MKLCLEFSTIPSGVTLPDRFSLSSFDIEALAPPGGFNVRDEGGRITLGFLSGGLKLVLPVARRRVDLIIGTFATAVDVSCHDENRDLISAFQVYKRNDYTESPIALATPIKFINIYGGNNEGSLAAACIEFNISD